MKKIIRYVIIIFILSFCFTNKVYGLDDTYDYVINKYNINMKVNENNSFDITETITAYFNVEKHGIYRTIPLKNIVKRLDGTSYQNRARISNLSVNSNYSKYREDDNLKIQIGDADKTITGRKTYVIKYRYSLSGDETTDYDELYYNIIGDNWDTKISNITFTISMPKEFDKSKLGFSAGEYGSVDSNNIDYSLDGNTITGKYNKTLNPYEALTVRCELENGYFVSNVNFLKYLMIILPLLFAIISYLLWKKYGKDEKPVLTVEFYPPNNLNSLDIGYIYKEAQASGEDVISLLIYLANKGYLKISKIEKDGLFSKEGFKVTKVKEYDGDDSNEKTFFQGLFEDRNEVDNKKLTNTFYTTVSKILLNANKKEKRNKIINNDSLKKKPYIITMIIISFLLITIIPMYEYGSSIGDILKVFSVSIVGFTLSFYVLFSNNLPTYINGVLSYSNKKGKKIVPLALGLLFIFVSFLEIFPSLQGFYLVAYFIGLISTIFMILFVIKLPKRTKYGNEMLGKILGFRNFLETAEKDKLEELVNDNPTYFYDILPYTYVLGVSDKWIKKFETISMRPPAWYDSSDDFDTSTFNRFINDTMLRANDVMTSSPSSSSSNSGGGFSGGGSGGGGGGSW